MSGRNRNKTPRNNVELVVYATAFQAALGESRAKDPTDDDAAETYARHEARWALKRWRACFPRGVELSEEPPGDAGLFLDDTDPADSDSLRRLREIIDSHLGWRDMEQQEAGDYEARLVEIGKALVTMRKVWSGDEHAGADAIIEAMAVLRTVVFP